MKVWQVIGIVDADGWQLVRTLGSHRQYKHPEKRRKAAIPGKRSDDFHPRTDEDPIPDGSGPDVYVAVTPRPAA
jgi:predicted RNA binding protein YcfA (HicA-like mRNA interferase family)